MSKAHAPSIGLCLALLSVGTSWADIPGRLFFSPEQRGMLDNARRLNTQQAAEEQASSQGEITFNGFVRRSDGHTTMWVNGRQMAGEHNARGPIGEKHRAASKTPLLVLPSLGNNTGLKPGQKFDPASGKALEAYQAKPVAGSASTVPAQDGRAPSPAPGGEH